MSGLAELVAGDFEPLVGEAFGLQGPPVDGDEVVLRLVSVRRGRPVPGHREPFALLFEGPVAPALGQDVRPLLHPALGTLEIFLVPVEADGAGCRYEAVFG